MLDGSFDFVFCFFQQSITDSLVDKKENTFMRELSASYYIGIESKSRWSAILFLSINQYVSIGPLP